MDTIDSSLFNGSYDLLWMTKEELPITICDEGDFFYGIMTDGDVWKPPTVLIVYCLN